MDILYKNKILYTFQYIVRPICIIIAVVCTVLLWRSGILAPDIGIFFLVIPIALIICVLCNILMVTCIKDFSIKSNIICINYIKGFSKVNYNIETSNIKNIIAEYKLKKHYFIEQITNPDKPEIFDLYISINYKNGARISLKHNVDFLEILKIFTPLTKIVSDIQIYVPTGLSQEIERLREQEIKNNKHYITLKNFEKKFNGTLYQFKKEEEYNAES